MIGAKKMVEITIIGFGGRRYGIRKHEVICDDIVAPVIKKMLEDRGYEVSVSKDNCVVVKKCFFDDLNCPLTSRRQMEFEEQPICF